MLSKKLKFSSTWSLRSGEILLSRAVRKSSGRSDSLEISWRYAAQGTKGRKRWPSVVRNNCIKAWCQEGRVEETNPSLKMIRRVVGKEAKKAGRKENKVWGAWNHFQYWRLLIVVVQFYSNICFILFWNAIKVTVNLLLGRRSISRYKDMQVLHK